MNRLLAVILATLALLVGSAPAAAMPKCQPLAGVDGVATDDPPLVDVPADTDRICGSGPDGTASLQRVEPTTRRFVSNTSDTRLCLQTDYRIEGGPPLEVGKEYRIGIEGRSFDQSIPFEATGPELTDHPDVLARLPDAPDKNLYLMPPTDAAAPACMPITRRTLPVRGPDGQLRYAPTADCPQTAPRPDDISVDNGDVYRLLTPDDETHAVFRARGDTLAPIWTGGSGKHPYLVLQKLERRPPKISRLKRNERWQNCVDLPEDNPLEAERFYLLATPRTLRLLRARSPETFTPDPPNQPRMTARSGRPVGTCPPDASGLLFAPHNEEGRVAGYRWHLVDPQTGRKLTFPRSGRIPHATTAQPTFDGRPLEPDQPYVLRVRAIGFDGQISEPADIEFTFPQHRTVSGFAPWMLTVGGNVGHAWNARGDRNSGLYGAEVSIVHFLSDNIPWGCWMGGVGDYLALPRADAHRLGLSAEFGCAAVGLEAGAVYRFGAGQPRWGWQTGAFLAAAIVIPYVRLLDYPGESDGRLTVEAGAALKFPIALD
jgi:hypothetical protein